MRGAPLLAVALALVACGPPAETLEPRDFQLAGRAWSIPLPASAEIRAEGAAVALDFAPGRRQPRLVTLAPADPVALATPFPLTADLPEGAELDYETATAEGGSGGPESMLRGVWRRGETVFGVACHAQAEPDAPPADWCVAYLRGLTER